MFICYLYYIPYNGNTILRKFRKDMKPTLNHVHMLMSNFLLGLKRYRWIDFSNESFENNIYCF